MKIEKLGMGLGVRLEKTNNAMEPLIKVLQDGSQQMRDSSDCELLVFPVCISDTKIFTYILEFGIITR